MTNFGEVFRECRTTKKWLPTIKNGGISAEIPPFGTVLKAFLSVLKTFSFFWDHLGANLWDFASSVLKIMSKFAARGRFCHFHFN